VKVVDSSVWIEFLADGPAADRVLPHLTDLGQLITPTIVLLEVYRKLVRDRGLDAGIVLRELLEGTRVIPLSADLALSAAAHFRGLAGVAYLG
jgi:predicted nucleic acid-binding protein